MSEYDHMMRGGKTGSGPMADHIQARPLCFFCARHASGPRHLPADMHLLLVAFFSLTYFFQSNVDRRERLRKCVHFSVLLGGLLTSSQACYGDDRFEQGRVLYEEPLGTDGMQALPHTASHRRFVLYYSNMFTSHACISFATFTIHGPEGSYLAHTQGKRHQENIGRRAAREAQRLNTAPTLTIKKPTRPKAPRIGRPGYFMSQVKRVELLSHFFADTGSPSSMMPRLAAEAFSFKWNILKLALICSLVTGSCQRTSRR